MFGFIPKHPSSHTVIASAKKEIPDKVLVCAAEIRLITQSAYVAKCSGGLYLNKICKTALAFGQVTSNRQKTLFVNPSKHEEFLIK